MAIDVACQCGKTFKVRDDLVGKRARCSACGTVMRISIVLPVQIEPIRLVENAPDPEPADEIDRGNESETEVRRWWIDPTLGIGLSIPALILIAFGLYLYGKHRTGVLIESARAVSFHGDDLVREGKLDDAYAEYGRAIGLAEKAGREHVASQKTIFHAKEERARIGPIVERERKEKERVAADKAKEIAELKAWEGEERRLAKHKVKLIGGTFITRNSGHSDILRGLPIILLKAKIPKSSVTSLFPELAIKAARNMEIWKAKAEAEEREKMTLLNAARMSVNLQWAVEMAEKSDEDLLETGLLFAVIRANQWGEDYGKKDDELLIKVVEESTDWLDVVRATKVDVVTSDIDGKYEISEITGGHYVLYSRFESSISLVEWFLPLELGNKPSQTQDLSNFNANVIANKTE